HLNILIGACGILASYFAIAAGIGLKVGTAEGARFARVLNPDGCRPAIARSEALESITRDHACLVDVNGICIRGGRVDVGDDAVAEQLGARSAIARVT